MAWSAGETYVSAGLSFVFTAWLARILTSADFGLATAASIATLFFSVLTEAVTSTVIQHKNATRGQLATIFWLCLAALFASYVVIFTVAPLIASYTGAPHLTGILRVAALQLPLMAFVIIPVAQLRRSLRFRALAITQIISAIAAGIVAIALAWRGFGYWSIIAQGLIFYAARILMLAGASRYRPLIHVDISEARPLLGYGRNLLGFTTVNYWSRNVDMLLVGRVFGAEQLGFYSLAFRLIGVSVQMIARVFQPLLHPTLVAMDDDVVRMRAAYLKVVRGTALIMLPIGAVLWAAAPWIVQFVWGEGWQPVAPILRGLALMAAVQPVNALSASIYMARDATRMLFWLSVVNAVFIVAAVLAGLPFGVAGVAWASSIIYALIVAPLSSGIAFVRLLNGPPGALMRALLPGVAVAALIAGAAAMLGQRA